MSSGVCFSLNSTTSAKSAAMRVKNVCKGARELNRERKWEERMSYREYKVYKEDRSQALTFKNVSSVPVCVYEC